MVSKESIKLLAVIVTLVVVGSAVPAAAIIANADKVDGFDAVGYGASISARKGKLVATSKSTGRLPNNIIATAPDSAKLGGKTAAQLRTMSVPVSAGHISGGASLSLGSVIMPNTSSSWWISLMIPPEHPTSVPISLDLVFGVDGAESCAWQADTLGAVSQVGATTLQRNWFVTDSTTSFPISVPAGTSTVFKHTFILQGTVAPTSAVKFGLTRVQLDTNACGDVNLRGVLVHY